MGLLGSIINIIGKGVAKGVSEVVEKKVAEAVKPAATKLAKKQADLIDSVTRDIERASESINQAGEAAEKAATENPEELKRAMEILRQSAQKASEEIEKLEVEKEQTDEEVMAQWETLLPDYPKWECGGNHFSFEEEEVDGLHIVRFYLSAVEAYWTIYKTVLAANGFCMKYRQDTAYWYKEVDGRYPAVHIFHIDDDACEMILVFCNETKEDIEEATKL